VLCLCRRPALIAIPPGLTTVTIIRSGNVVNGNPWSFDHDNSFLVAQNMTRCLRSSVNDGNAVQFRTNKQFSS
jgi:hypothetical protein